MYSRYSVVLITIMFVSTVCQVNAQSGPATSEKRDQGEFVMAVVNGTHKVTVADVDSLFPFEVKSASERLETLRASGLEALITRAVLSEQAQRRGLSLDAFLESLVPDKVEIDRIDVEREYLESGRSVGTMDEAQARVLLRIQIEAQRKVAAFRSSIAEFRKRAEITMTRSGTWQSGAEVSRRGHSLGSGEAIAVLTVFTDFECPYCRRAHDVIRRLAKEFEDNLRIVYKHFPLSIHRNAFQTAIASECAARQNSFWPYIERVFAAIELSDELIIKAAESSGLDLKAFEECRVSGKMQDIVLADMRDAKQAAVSSTPSMFLNGRMLKSPSYENLKAEIEVEVNGQRTGSRGAGTRNGEQIR